VLEVVRAVEDVTGKKVPYTVGPRREGDSASLVAASGKLRSTLGWNPRFSELRTIIDHAWRFSQGKARLKTPLVT
jgi:UDP-glucose 4-epimerase